MILTDMKGKMGQKECVGADFALFSSLESLQGREGPALSYPLHPTEQPLISGGSGRLTPGDTDTLRATHSLPPHCSHGSVTCVQMNSRLQGERSLGTPACGVRGDSGPMTSHPLSGESCLERPHLWTSGWAETESEKRNTGRPLTQSRVISIALKKEKPLRIKDEALVTLNLIVCSVHGLP